MERAAIAVVVGVDVGKEQQHAVALDGDGMLLLDRTVANDEGQLRALLGPMQDRGTVLLVVDQPSTIGAQIEALVAPDPLYPVLTSLVGVGVRTAATFLVETAGKEFASAAELASYAGVCPVTWRAGTSVHRDRPSRRGNTRLKHALFQSAFASLRHPPSKTYYGP